jgi:hypothetical protein
MLHMREYSESHVGIEDFMRRIYIKNLHIES